VITENNKGDISTFGTLILTAPTNFQFTSAGTGSFVSGKNVTGVTTTLTNATTITITISGSGTNAIDAITISGIQMIGINALTGASNILRTGGTSVIAGDATNAIHATVNSQTGTVPTGTLTATETSGTTNNDNIICSGSNVTFTATTGFTIYNFKVNGSSVQSGSANTYGSTTLSNGASVTVDVTNSNGCKSTFGPQVITVNALPSISGTLTVCPGSSTKLTGTGLPGTTPWTSSNTGIATIDNSGNVTGVSVGTSTITYQNSNGCTTTAVVTVTAPTITTGGTMAAVCPSASAQTTTLAYTATTNSPTSYSIDWNATANAAGLADQGTTTFTFVAGGGSLNTIAITANTPAGTYSGTMTIANANGCTNTQAVSVTVNTPPTVSSSSSSLCIGSTITLSPSSGGTWTSSNTAVATVVSTTGVATGVAAGTVTFTFVSTSSGCSATTSSITVNGTPTAGNIGAVRDGGRCGVRITSTTDGTCPDGSTPTYIWQRKPNGTSTWITVTDSTRSELITPSDSVGRAKYRRITVCGSCTSAPIQLNSPISGYMSAAVSVSNNVSCFGGANGTATVTITGGTAPFSYAWNNTDSGTTQTTTATSISTLNSGSYTLTVTDNAGPPACHVNTTFTISQPAVLSGSMTNGNTTLCQNSTSPNITFTGSGGTTPYAFTYNINSGTSTNANTTGTNASVNVAASTATAGTFIYNLTALTDANGCAPSPAVSGADTFVVNPAPTVTISGSSSIAPCYGTTGSVTITGTPNANVTYTMNGVTQPTVMLDATGNYTITNAAITGTTTYALTNVQNATSLCTATPTAPTSVTFSVNTGSYSWTGLNSSDWNTGANWCSGTVPTAGSNVSIPASSSTPNSPIISTANANAASVTIASGGILTMSGAFNLNIASTGSFTNNGSFDASASTGAVIFAGGNTVNGSSTTSFRNITTNGALALTTAPNINGTFTITSGAVSGNAPTYGSSSKLTYNITGAYTAGVEWNTGGPSTTSAGAGVPQDVNIQAGSISIPNSGGANRALAGNLTIGAGTTLQMPAGSGIDLYILGNWTNNGGTFNANGRRVNFIALSGTQTVTGNTTFYDVSLNNSGATTDFSNSTITMTDEFRVTSGTMNGNTSTFIFTGATSALEGVGAKNFYNLQINSGAVVSDLTASAGNTHISNSFVNNGSFNQNTAHTTYFDKSAGTETFTGAGSTTFGNLTIGNNGFSTATALNCSANFTVGGGSFSFVNGSVYNGSNNTATFSTNAATISGSGTASFYNAITNVALNPGSGISTMNITFTINTGGSVNTNAPVYGSSATLIYNTTTPAISTGIEWTNNTGSTGAGAPFNVTVQNANSVLLSGPLTVPGTLNVATGNSLDINSNTLTVNTAFSGTGNLKGSAASGLITSGVGTVYFAAGPYNQLKTLSVNSGGNLTLGGNVATGDTLNIVPGDSTNGFGTVTVNGSLHTGNLLTLKSGATATAMVGPSNGNIFDTVTAERYFPALRSWRFVGLPFSSTNQSINAAWQEGQVDATLTCPPQYTGTPGYGTEISQNNDVANGFDRNNTGYTSLEVYQNNAWVTPATTYSNLVTTSSNNAYSLFVRGDRTVCLTDVFAPDVTTLRPRGILNEHTSGGDLQVNFSGAKPGDFLLIGNPFAAPLNIETTVKTRNSGLTADQFWVWNPTLGGTNGTGGYVAFSGGVQVPFDLNNDTTNYAANTVIQSGEAFMVQVSSTDVGGTGSLTFKESDKSGIQRTTGVFGLTATKQPQQHFPPALFVNLLDTSKQLMDGVAVSFGNKLSTHPDAVNAPKRWNEEIENIAIVKHDTTLSIDFRPVPKESDSVKLRLYLRQQPYILQVFTKGVKADLPAEAWLVDKYLGTRTQLDLYHTNLYSFTPNRDTNSSRNRFMVVFNRTGKQDQDRGTRTTTPPMAGNNPEDRGTVSLYPNPVTAEGRIMLQFTNMPSGSYTATIYNAAGEQLSINTIEHTGGNTAYRLQAQASWSSGVYNLRVINKDGDNIKNLTFILKR
jgi:hypothetical protein